MDTKQPHKESTLSYYKKHPYMAIAAILCSLTVAVLYALWISKNPGYSSLSKGMALTSALLFTLWGLRFLPQWAESFSKPVSRPLRAKEGQWKTCLLLFVGLLLFCGFVLLCFELRRCIKGYYPDLWSYLKDWKPSDSGHYMDIARDWYSEDAEPGRQVQLVFLPGLPLLLRGVNALIGDYLFSGLLISVLSFALSGVVGYKLFAVDYDESTALQTVSFFCLLPGSFFFAVPMTESLFMLLSLLTVYCARTHRFVLAGLVGAYAAFTRSLGVVLLVPAVYEYIVYILEQKKLGELKLRKNLPACLGLLLIPLGLGAYLYVNYQVSGDAFRFLYYQRYHWSQQLSYFFNTAAYQIGYLRGALDSGDITTALGLWLPNVLCFFGANILLLLGARRLRPAYSAYAIAYYVIAMGTTWLLSGPRYLLVLFPLPLSLALLCKKPLAKALAPLLLAVLGMGYLLCFINRWQVW